MNPGCPCGKIPSGMRVLIGGQPVGLAGLESAFTAWKSAGRIPAELSVEELTSAVAQSNYVPPGLRAEYNEAVRRLYEGWAACSK